MSKHLAKVQADIKIDTDMTEEEFYESVAKGETKLSYKLPNGTEIPLEVDIIEKDGEKVLKVINRIEIDKCH